MKRLKIIKRVVETLLLIFAVVLIKISFSRQLNPANSIISLIGVVLIVLYVLLNEILEEVCSE